MPIRYQNQDPIVVRVFYLRIRIRILTMTISGGTFCKESLDWIRDFATLLKILLSFKFRSDANVVFTTANQTTTFFRSQQVRGWTHANTQCLKSVK
jgi:hypothetical protein